MLVVPITGVEVNVRKEPEVLSLTTTGVPIITVPSGTFVVVIVKVVPVPVYVVLAPLPLSSTTIGVPTLTVPSGTDVVLAMFIRFCQ